MNSVKITSGTLRGRKIATPGGNTHPMGERERLALFNMLTDYIPGAKVLDAFAGSGALGIEAMSRGALTAEFVEKNPKACQVIRDNLKKLNLEAKVTKSSVLDYASDAQFDLILADPPYTDFKVEEVKHLLRFLKSGGVLALSHPGDAPDLPEMELIRSRKYAGASISLYFKR